MQRCWRCSASYADSARGLDSARSALRADVDEGSGIDGGVYHLSQAGSAQDASHAGLFHESVVISALDQIILVPLSLLECLRWWMCAEIRAVGMPLRPPQPSLMVTTDAS